MGCVERIVGMGAHILGEWTVQYSLFLDRY